MSDETREKLARAMAWVKLSVVPNEQVGGDIADAILDAARVVVGDLHEQAA